MNTAILVTGYRKWEDEVAISSALALYENGNRILIHGDAKGADTIAAKYARKMGFQVIKMPAQWKALGRAAGHARNQKMLEVLLALKACGYDCSVMAFLAPQSRGTRDMIARAEACPGIAVRIINHVEKKKS